MKFKACLLIFWFVATGLTASAQTDSSAFLRHAVSSLEKRPAVEKVYLHLDKQDYNFGDTIWYKAYTVIGVHHQLSALSGVLYVELISPEDSLVSRQRIALVSGIGWSDSPLPHTLKPGAYRIRAYTRWMQNTGSDCFYDQSVQIGGLAPETLKQITQKHPDVQFFPEGGQLVNGVRSRVAVKAVRVNGLGEDIKGTIEDNEGNTVADFATQHLGMGVFAFIPQSGKTYKAKISGTGETAFTIDLPKAQEIGYTLAISNSEKDSIYIKVAVNDQTFNQQKNSTFYIIAQSSGKVYYTTEGKLDGTVYAAKVEKSRFPTGIAQFTLFSQNGEPLAERIAYIEGNDTLKLNITSPAASYAARQNVKLSLQAKDNDNVPVAGSFSVAVINESRTAIDQDAESTIMNNLLLTSDLKGFIEKPNYYFTHVNEESKANLDLLMLTQGYRRFEWKQVLDNKDPALAYQPESSLQLAGTLKTTSGKPVPNGKITLMAAKDNLLRDTTADINGNYKFTKLYLPDSEKVVLRARKKNDGSNVVIYVKQNDYARLNKVSFPGDSSINRSPEFSAAMHRNYEDYRQRVKFDSLKNGHLLKEVKIKGSRPPKTPELRYSSNLNGPGEANQIIMGSDLYNCINLSDCLVGKIFGVTFIDGIPYSLRVNTISKRPPLTIIIDGIVTAATSHEMDNLSASDVYSIEVLRSGAYLAIYGSEAPGGALVITTKRGSEDGYAIANRDPTGIITYPFSGFYKARKFYSPKYGTKNNVQQPDLRSTIYWNPNIITDKDGKATFEYFNADTKGTYRVVVEGIDDNGNLGRQVYRYKVE
jgi:hypothetical protein